MNTQNINTNATAELIELASLDALGLLDEDERRQFEQAFSEASAPVRAQVRREQARIALDESLQSDVEPPASLRERVLARVREAMSTMAHRSERAVLARIAPYGGWSLRSNVSPLWRAACIGFATASVVILSVGYRLHSEYNQALVAFSNGTVAGGLAEQFTPKFAQMFLNPSTQAAMFTPVSVASAGDEIDRELVAQAVLYMNRDHQYGVLFCRGLPATDGEYQLVILDANGASTTLDRFASKGELMYRDVPRVSELEAGSRLAIVATSAAGRVGQVVLAVTL